MTIEYLKVFENDSPRVKGLSFHPKRPWLLASLHTGLIQLWDYRMGYLLCTFHEHEGPVRCVSFHPSQSLFVSGGDDSKVRVWNPQSALTSQAPMQAKGKGTAATALTRSLFTLSGHLDYVRSVSFHSESPWILSASDDQTIRIWNWQSRTCLAVLTGHNHYVMCATFGPPGGRGGSSDLVASASLDQTIRVWDISGLRKKNAAATSSASSPYGVHSSYEMSAGSHYPGASSGSAHGQPELFAMNEVMVKHILEGHDRGVNWVEFHASGNYLVSAADDRQVKIWQLDGMRAWESDSLTGHFNNVSCVTYAYGGDVILSDSEDRTIRVWDAHRKTCLHTIRRDNDRFWAIIGHPSEKENLFAASHDAGFVVFKLERERPAFCTFGSQLMYVQGKSLKACELRPLSDEQMSLMATGSKTGSAVVPIQTLGLIGTKSGGNACPIGEAPRQLVYNATDGSFLLYYYSSSNSGNSSSSGSGSGSGASFEFYPSGGGVDRSGLRSATSATLSSSLKGTAKSVFFLTRNRFAVLESEGRAVQIYTVQKELSKSVSLSFAARSMFPASMTSVLLTTLANDKLVLFDLQLMKVVAEVPTPSGSSEIRHVEWSPDHSLLAYSTKYQIFVYTRKLDVLVASVTSDVPIKSLMWWSDAQSSSATFSSTMTATATGTSGSSTTLGQVLYYSTFFHVKYLLPSSAESGLLCQTPSILYLAAIRDRTLYALDRRSNLVTLCVDPSEVYFKVALERNDMDTVVRMISSGCLIGQSIIAYLRKKGYPQMALRYVKDPLTRFELAIECADLSIAFDMAQALDREPVWTRFAEEALLLGHHGLVEVAYMRTKSYQKLLFLYLVTGQGQKIQKLKASLSPAEPTSAMLRMMCDLVLGETADMCRTLKESGQDMLCYLTARTNGYTEVCEAMAAAGGESAVPELVSGLELSLSSMGVSERGPLASLIASALPGSGEDWPIVGSVDELVVKAHGGQRAAALAADASREEFSDAMYPMSPGDRVADEDEFHAATSPYSDTGAGVGPGARGASMMHDAVDANAWGIDDEAPMSPVMKHSSLHHHAGQTAAGGSRAMGSPAMGGSNRASEADLPAAGNNPAEISLSNSSLPLDHILNGSFEIGMQLLHRQYGIVHFAPLKSKWMSIYASARLLHPTGGLCAQSPSILDFIYDGAEREGRKLSPLHGLSTAALRAQLDTALLLTTQGKFSDAVALFRATLYSLLLSPSFSTGELNDVRDTCREYIAALSMELRRKSIVLPAPGATYSAAEGAALKQAFLLVALFTHCALHPTHKLLSLRVALTLAYKYGSWKLALGFGRRLLDLHPSEPTLGQTNKIVAACEAQISQLVAASGMSAADPIPLPEYEPLMPFAICHASWTPVYTKRAGAVSDLKHCSFCSASYSSNVRGAVGCSICELTVID